MATEREEIRYDGGRGGKFQKRSGRRTHSTPYDRPPTAIRNPTGNGWLSKLVDPAQKLIVSGAHRLFSTVFSKRLLPPPPPPPLPLSREANGEMESKNQEAVPTDPRVIQGTSALDVAPSSNSNMHAVTDLEQILKEKTFTRSEINRLTELLNSRIVNVPSGVEERKSELVPYTPLSSRGRTDVSLKFPAQDGFGTPVVSSHIERSNVLEEDVASPAEIAKAYMGSRPLKATPSVMVSHSQTLGDNFGVSSNPPKLSSVSLVQRSSGNVDVIENGFVTPRSRGRSALYSMARMPYSRVRATPSLKSNVDSTDAYRATTSSSSQLPWEQGRLLGSRPEGALKRRSLGLDNEMGSVGPIRRIRQKSNLLSPKGHNNDTVPSSSFRPIPLRSSEMASKILEQLDKLTPPKEKISELKPLSVRNNSPTKLSPSMLHGPALRSLEDVNSPKYLENVQDTQLNDARDFTSQTNDRVGESSSLKFKVPYDKSIISAGDGISSTVLTKDLISSSTVPVSSITTPSQRKWAFQMSAHEDFVDLDEEGHSNGVATGILAERREQFDGPLVGKKPSGIEAITVEKPHTSTEVKASIFSELNQVSDHGKSDVSVATEKSTGFSFPTSASSSLTVNAIGPESTLRSEKLVSSEVPTVTPPIFSSGDKLPSQKETIASVPSFTFGGKITPANEQNAVPIVTFGDNIPPTQLTTVPTTLNFGEKVTFPISANTVTENGNKNAVSQFKYSSSLVNEKESANVGGAVVFKAESSGSLPSFAVSKESMSDKADNKNSSAGLTAVTPQNVFFSSVSASTPTPTPSIFSFVSNSNNSNLNNGSFVSTTSSFFPAPTSSFSNNITNQNPSTKPSLTAATSSSESITITSPSTSVPIPAFSATPILKFESSTDPSTSVSPVSALTAVESVETKTKQETTFGNLSGSLPSGTSSKMSSTGSVYQFGAAVTASDANKRSESSTFVSGNVPVFGAPILPSGGSGIASSTQSMPMQFGSSSSTSFGLTGNSAVSSGSSLFASSAPASNLFNSGSTFGLLSSSSSAANSVSSSAGTGSSYFPNTWQSSSAPLFSTTAFNPSTSTGFSFGLLSSTNSASMPFGSSTSASTSSVFSFTSAAATASPQPVFGSNQAFGFASNSPVNNDQVNMMDSMAEDTVQTIVPTPVFGQQPLSPPPSSGCIFGSTPPMGASPFQFGSQPNIPTPQNPSPFQASGSLDFNASGGGNFSLGAGGGDKSNRKYVKVKSKSRKK